MLTAHWSRLRARRQWAGKMTVHHYEMHILDIPLLVLNETL